MFVSHIIDAFGGKSSSCEMPDDPFNQKKRPILTPFQRENRKIQGVGQKRKVQQTLEFTGLFWRRGWDSNPCAIARKLISSQPRYDHFDTSPCMSNTVRTPWTSKKRKTKMLERRVRTAKYLVFRTRENPWKQRETGGRKSLSCGGFRVSPVMTTSRRLHVCSPDFLPQKLLLKGKTLG